MSIGATLGFGFGGFIAGLLLFNGVLRWVGTVLVLAKDPTRAGSRGKGLRIALATVFGSGFWLMVVGIWGAYFVHTERYATSLFVGATLAIAYMGGIVVWFRLKQRSRGGKNAA